MAPLMNCMGAKKSVGRGSEFTPVVYVLVVSGSAPPFVATPFIWQFVARKDVFPSIGGSTKQCLEILSALLLTSNYSCISWVRV